jgi:hypothetical protein
MADGVNEPMLGMKTYTQEYIDACRAKSASCATRSCSTRASCRSTGFQDGRNSAGASIKLPPEKSVLKLGVGDDVKLSEADFVRLSKAFSAQIEKKYL